MAVILSYCKTDVSKSYDSFSFFLSLFHRRRKVLFKFVFLEYYPIVFCFISRWNLIVRVKGALRRPDGSA